MILLDTHVLAWLAAESARLGRRAASAIDRALRDDAVAVSAFSFWELAMLAAKGRVELDDPPAAVRRKTLEQGFCEIAVTGDIGIAAAELDAFHGDPADRIIVATAVALGATLVTGDESILAWRAGKLRVRDARR